MPIFDQDTTGRARQGRAKLALAIAAWVAGSRLRPVFDSIVEASTASNDGEESGREDRTRVLPPRKLVIPPEVNDLPATERVRLGIAVGTYGLVAEHPWLIAIALLCVCFWVYRFFAALGALL